jgi:hypothetical protein
MNRQIILILSLLVMISFINAGIALANERVKVIEMGESGQIVEFPMSPEEVASENEKNTRLATIREAKLRKQKKHRVTYELAESGIIIEFPVTSPEISTENRMKKLMGD